MAQIISEALEDLDDTVSTGGSEKSTNLWFAENTVGLAKIDVEVTIIRLPPPSDLPPLKGNLVDLYPILKKAIAGQQEKMT